MVQSALYPGHFFQSLGPCKKEGCHLAIWVNKKGLSPQIDDALDCTCPESIFIPGIETQLLLLLPFSVSCDLGRNGGLFLLPPVFAIHFFTNI